MERKISRTCQTIFWLEQNEGQQMSNTDFLRRLNYKVFESLFNNFGKENFDEYRYGTFQKQSLKEKFSILCASGLFRRTN